MSDVADLAADTTPTPISAGRYHLEISRRWNFALPSGGVLATAALRAASQELADEGLRLGSATAIFCTPIQPGALDLDVTILRRGGSAAQIRTTVRAGGAPEVGFEVVATFCRDRRGPDVRGARMPDVPPPDACPSVIDEHGSNPHPKSTFFAQVDCRVARGDRFWLGGWEARAPRYARWFRYRAPQRDAAGRFDRLALAPLADTMPPALLQAIGPGEYRFYAPSCDLTLHAVDDTDREWVLVSVYARRARAGWAIAEAELWDDTGRLLGVATQTMYISHLRGEPPIIDASDR
ncbi:MAG TPA: thioesterase family protein [Kofleriaceae bacterium]|jgi:acyl-CoA thioesterase|nr:thioesterase family protein [Kofleriaceae bacterium]